MPPSYLFTAPQIQYVRDTAYLKTGHLSTLRPTSLHSPHLTPRSLIASQPFLDSLVEATHQAVIAKQDSRGFLSPRICKQVKGLEEAVGRMREFEERLIKGEGLEEGMEGMMISMSMEVVRAYGDVVMGVIDALIDATERPLR